MTSTILVLAITLAFYFLLFVALLVTVSVLARRNGQKIKSLSLSPAYGITAEFFESSERNSHDS